MTKRISQTSTVVVPAAEAHAAPAAAKVVVVPADAEVVFAKAEAAVEVKEEAPVTATVAEPVMAMVAPAPLAMTAEPTAAAEPAAPAAQDSSDDDGDSTAYIVGGVLLAGGVLAVALSSGGDDSTPTPTPTPTPTNSVTFSSAATASIAENSAITTTVIDVNAAAAATGGAITYTLGGTDAASFDINASTGVVTFKASPNFEAKASYSITVTATSAANGTTPSASASQTIAISVTNVNEAPSFAAATGAATVAENAAASTVVYTVPAATDPDANTTLTYTLGGTDAAAFNFDAATRQVTLKAPADYETKNSYSFTITASDGSLSATHTVTLGVTNVNEAPTITSGATGTVAENAPVATVIYDANATDPDANTTLTYSLSGADAGLLNINAATGEVTLKASADFETKNSYSFNVIATDNGNPALSSAPKAVVVSVTDVAEGPPAVTIALDGATSVSGVGAGGSAQATTFTENAAAPNVTTITNFGADDRIVVTGVNGATQATSYSFSSFGSDLTIDFNNNGVSSKITLVGVAGNTFVFDEASAEKAVGTFLGVAGGTLDFFRYG